MRFITLLNPVKKLPPYIQDDNSGVKSFRQSQAVKTYKCYDKLLYDKYMLLTKFFESDSKFRSAYKQIVNKVHPFDRIINMITSKWISNCKPMKTTNAFMKMYEFMKWLDIEYKYFKQFTNSINVFDIAGAPGMFILAMEQYFNKYHKDVKLNWATCSLEGGTALKDDYGLYKSNPERYTPCDVMNVKNLQTIINKRIKYDMVVGDIGIYHENDYEHLQEEHQLDIEWGQMILGLNIVKQNGIMILKMYSLTSVQSLLLLDTLSYFFNKVYVVKPYTSRIFNAECYIICMNKNDISPSNIPLTRPYPSDSYRSINLSVVSSFEYMRNDIKSSISLAVTNPSPYSDSIIKNYLSNLHPLYTELSK